MSTPADKLQIGKALGKIPSGVFILTVRDGGTWPATAMMASWVQQAGFDPPILSVAIAKERAAAALVRREQRFALSVLGRENHALMRKYARGVSPDQNPFGDVATRQSPGGLPILTDAIAFLECRLVQVYDFGGDHDLYVANIEGGEMLGEDQPFTHVRGNGFHY